MAGPHHPRHAVESAQDLFRAAEYGSAEGPWIPLGAGVHTGTAFVGLVSRGPSYEFTALGDTPHVAPAPRGAGGTRRDPRDSRGCRRLGSDGLERRHLSLKGHPVDALVVPLSTSSTSQM